MTKHVKTEVTGDRQTNQLQSNINSATSQLRAGPFGTGNPVMNVSFSDNVPKAVNTGLGQKATGWVMLGFQGIRGGSLTEKNRILA